MTTQQTAASKKTLPALLLAAALLAGVFAYMTVYDGPSPLSFFSKQEADTPPFAAPPALPPQASALDAPSSPPPLPLREPEPLPEAPAAEPAPPAPIPEPPLAEAVPPAGEDEPVVPEQTPAEPQTREEETDGEENEREVPPQPADPAGTAGSSAPGVIYYEKVQTDGTGATARGDISARTPVVGGAAASRSGVRDPLVTDALTADLARFLADNYWPAGSHPQARRSGVITADLKWINMRYGGQMRGLSGGGAPAAERRRVLDYVYAPSMLRSLYALQADNFFLQVEQAIAARAVEPDARPLTNAQAAELCSLYAGMASGLSGAVTAYGRIPIRRGLIEAYTDAAAQADAAYTGLAESTREDGAATDRLARNYQTAVVLREQQKENLAAAMRKNGSVGTLDSTTLVYAAMWLNRRGDEKAAANDALAAVLADAGRRFAAMAQNYSALSPKAPVSSAVSTAPVGLQ